MTSLRSKMFAYAAAAALMTLFSGSAGIIGMKLIDNNVDDGVQSVKVHAEALLDVEQAQFAYRNQVQDFKNIMIRGNDQASYDKYAAAFAKAEAQVISELGEAQRKITKVKMEPAVMAKLDEVLREHKKLSEAYGAAIKLFNVADPHAGKASDKMVAGKDQATNLAMIALMDMVRFEMTNELKDVDESVTATYDKVSMVVILLVIAGLALMMAISYVITTGLLKMLGGEPAVATDAVRRVADGDLRPHDNMNLAAADSLLGAVERMRASMQAMVLQLHSSSENLVNAAHRMANESAKVARSSTEQGEAMSSMAAAMEEMATSIAQVASNAEDAHNSALEAGNLSNEGTTVIHDATNEMRGIAEAMQDATAKIQALEEQSGKISMIVSVINEIANQTNLLALNAAIEAARAGEQGRGFAVVADEVRKLAERTTQSTQEIGGMIQGMRDVTEGAVQAMDAGNARVTVGVGKADRAVDSISQMKSGSTVVLGAVDEISSALGEQRSTAEEVARSVENIARNNEVIIQAVNQVASVSSQLEVVAQRLKDDAHRFRV
jgi:methyl-accepting chemotaxis protein